MTTLTSTPVVAGPGTQLARVAQAWNRAAIDFSMPEPAASQAPRNAFIGGERVASALRIALTELRAGGSRVCYENRGDHCSIYVFPDLAQGFQLNLRPRETSFSAKLAALASARPRIAPFVALVGPDGVGKSTVLRLVRERLAAEAPFLPVSFFQWRPELLPALSRLAGKGDSTRLDLKPRRTPGRFAFVRLAYYFADYLLGSWWKLRKSTHPRFIIFDRCALDMEVDPVRFGLPSAFGTRAIWRAIPKPAGVILLHDDARRIAARKDDLPEHEIRVQLAEWLRLAELDKVNATVEVDSPPEEIAARVYQVLIDSFVAAHEQDCPAGGETGIDRVERLLHEVRDASRPSRYVAVPNTQSARILIPIGATRADAAAGLSIYNAQRPIARFAKSCFAAALQTGLVQRFSPSSLVLNTGALELRLSEVLKCSVTLAMSLGAGAERERLVFQATQAGGAVVAFAKAGLDRAAIDALRHEESVLRSLANTSFAAGLVPSVVDAFDFGTARILVQSAPPAGSSDGQQHLSELHLSFLADLAHDRPAKVDLCIPENSADDLRRRGCPYYAHLIEWAAFELASKTLRVPAGLAHGDFTPWNMRLCANRLFVFDWEFASDGVPVAADLFHFVVSSAVELHHAQPGAIFADLTAAGHSRQMALRYLAALGVDEQLYHPLLISYLAGALIRSVITLETRADAKEQAMRRAWAGLLMLLRYRPEGDAK